MGQKAKPVDREWTKKKKKGKPESKKNSGGLIGSRREGHSV